MPDLGDLTVRINAELGPYRRQLKQAETSTRKTSRTMSRSFARVKASTAALAASVSRVASRIKTAMPVALAAVGGASIKLAKDFEVSLSRIVGLVGVSREQVQAWRQDILDLSPKVLKSPGELAEALFFITSAGLRGSNAMDALKASAQAASAGLGDTKSVADAVTSALNVYGAENLSAAKATGILVAAVREGKAEAQTFAPALGRLLSPANELGIEFNEVAAALAAMSRVGLSTEEASTALNAVFTLLTGSTKEAGETMQALGIDLKDLRDLAGEDLFAALTKLKEATGDNVEAFRAIVPNVRAARGILALVGGSAEATRKIFKSLADETGQSLGKAFREFARTDAAEFERSISSIKASLINLGSVILPGVASVLEQVGELFRGFPIEKRLNLQTNLAEIRTQITKLDIQLTEFLQNAEAGVLPGPGDQERVLRIQQERLRLLAEERVLAERLGERRGTAGGGTGGSGVGGAGGDTGGDGGTGVADDAAQTRRDAIAAIGLEADQMDRLLAAQRESEAAVARITNQIELENAARAAGIDLKSQEGEEFAELFRRGQQAEQAFEDMAEAQEFLDGVLNAGQTEREQLLDDLEKIRDLLDQGAISSEEFAKAQEKIKGQLGDSKELSTFEKFASDIKKFQLEFSDALAQMVVDGEFAFDALAVSFAKDFLERVIQEFLVSKLFNLLLGGGNGGPGIFELFLKNLASGFVTGGIGAAASGGGAPATPSAPTSAPMGGFAQGGIFRRPTRALIAEGGEPEAVIPISKLKQFVGEVGGGDVKVIVNTPPGSSVQTQERRDGDQRVIELMIGAVADDVSRGGVVSRALQQSFTVAKRSQPF